MIKINIVLLSGLEDRILALLIFVLHNQVTGIFPPEIYIIFGKQTSDLRKEKNKWDLFHIQANNIINMFRLEILF